MKDLSTSKRRGASLIAGALSLAALAAGCRPAAAAKPLIGVAIQGSGSGYGSARLAAIEKSAEGRASLEVMDGLGDRAQQLEQVGLLIKRKAKAIIAAPAASSDAAAIVAAAKAKNVPLVLIGGQPRLEVLRSWDKVIYVGHADAKAGAALGGLVAAAWRARPGADLDRDGALRLAFVGPAGALPENSAELRQGCLDELGRAGIKVDALEAYGADAAALLAGRARRVEAVASVDAASAAAAATTLEASASPKGAAAPPLFSVDLSRAAPAPGELDGAGLAGLVAGDPAAVGAAALDAAYALAFRRDPSDSGFEIADGKSVLVPCSATLSPRYGGASK